MNEDISSECIDGRQWLSDGAEISLNAVGVGNVQMFTSYMKERDQKCIHERNTATCLACEPLISTLV